jgi:hypothetical protein
LLCSVLLIALLLRSIWRLSIRLCLAVGLRRGVAGRLPVWLLLLPVRLLSIWLLLAVRLLLPIGLLLTVRLLLIVSLRLTG